MTRFNIGNAPCSWGKIETIGTSQPIGYAQMLDELAATGYSCTELGDWGYMPTEPQKLREELDKRQLKMAGSWVSIRLYDASYHQAGIDNALRVARLMAEAGAEDAVINIGDDHSTVEARYYNVGRIQPEHGLDAAGWQVYIDGASKLAEAVKQETGLRSCVHHHASSYLETPSEVTKFLELADENLISLCLDTGHYALGGGDPVAAIQSYAHRLGMVHFKDYQPEVLARASANNWNYKDLVSNGVFCELGQGSVDFAAVKAALEASPYRGWIIVEQDMLEGMGDPKDSAQRNRDYLKTLGL